MAGEDDLSQSAGSPGFFRPVALPSPWIFSSA